MSADWRPDFIGIGGIRCATTWGWTVLDAHPDCSMAQPKEIHFFDRNWGRGLEWYRSHFASGPARVRGEICPSYLYEAVVPERVHMTAPDVTLVLFLRNPFERALSHLLMDHQTVHGRSSDVDLETLRLLAAADRKYIGCSCYASALAPWLDHFPPSRFVVVRQDEVGADAGAAVRRLYTGLGLDASFVPEMIEDRINSVRDYRSPGLFRALSSLSQRLKARPGGRRLMEGVYRCSRMRELVLDFLQVDRGRARVDFDQVFDASDRAHLIAETERLPQMLGIEVPDGWVT
ncbi:MAG: sulfotransferase domain-containing protein [Planctomycetota bacterium]